MKKLLAVIMISCGLVGCASVQMGDANRDAELKKFAAPANNGGIYVYRNETMGAAFRMAVELDGQPLGETAAHTYLYKEVAPGKHTITSKAENTDSVEVEVKPGKLNYIWQEVKMGGFSPRSKLHVVDEAEGQKGVRESSLAVMQ